MLVKIEQKELARLRTIEAATQGFIDAIVRTGSKNEIAELLNRGPQKGRR